MSSLLDPAPATPLVDSPPTGTDDPTDLPFAIEIPPPAPVAPDQRLRAVTGWAPVTWLLVAANVGLFAAMALTHRRLFHFTQDALLSWGGGLAPRVFGPQWWRAGSYMFLHADLTHLAGNLLFLLLIAPLVERLLGPVRFALVYLFAGLGGGLLLMGTYPQHVAVGASAAVYGVYGAVVGCCLRGPRSAPWRAVAERGALLLLYTAVSLLGEWLDFAQEPVAHLGGFVFGLAGGLLCGHRLQARPARWRLVRLAASAAVFAGLISLTAWWVRGCTARARDYYGRYAAARDRERQVLGRFNDALRQWQQGKITSAEWKRLLEQTLIPAWQDTRSSCGLTFTGELAEVERESITMQDFWKALRSLRGESKPQDDKPLTADEYGKMYCLLCKVRLDTWRALAKDLPGNRILMVRAILDDRELKVLFAALDAEVNEDNSLHRWFESGRTGRRPAGKAAGEPDPGLIKNPGFENGLEGWSTQVYGARPAVELDAEVRHGGKCSLRVSADQPSDTAFIQEVQLKPRQRYRLSGWVRTRKLDPHGAMFGTFYVRFPDSSRALTSGANHQGDTDWTEVLIHFRTPNDGRVRIWVVFVAFGRGTGTAWFDDLKLVEVN